MPDRQIIARKLRLHHSIRKRREDRRLNGKEDLDYITHTLSERELDGANGDETGLAAEVQRLWEEAGMPEGMTLETQKGSGAAARRKINEAADKIAADSRTT